MGKSILKLLTVFALIFAVACQRKNSNKSNGPMPNEGGNPSNPNAGIQDEKAYVGIWMSEDLVNANGPQSMSASFAAFSIGEDFSYTSYSQYFDPNNNELKSPREILTVGDVYQLEFNEHKEARLKVSERFIQNAKDGRKSDKEVQKLVKQLEEDQIQVITFSGDASHLIHRIIYNPNDQKPLVVDTKFVKINQDIYNQKASEYLAYLEAIYNEKAQIFEYVSGHSYELIEQITQKERNGRIEESIVKSDDIDSESSFGSDGKKTVAVNAKSIKFASNIEGGASINKKYSTRLNFFDNKINNRLNLMFMTDAKSNKSYASILTHGEIVANDRMGMDIVQSNGTSKIIWKYRKVN